MASIPVKLALQGGGAHGAFTWGVLDRLLEIPGLVVESVCGTSSGGMNAAALAQGWARGGAAGARETLEAFWMTLGGRNAVLDWWGAPSWFLGENFPWPAMNHGAAAFNPLRSLVEEFFDVDVLRARPVALHVVATRIRDGALTVFNGTRLSHDALLASSSLPPLFPAVNIDGEAYWDGGFAGNPALEPLLHSGGDDLLCILLQPFLRSMTPRHARESLALSVELSFSAAFHRELRDIARAREQAEHHLWPTSVERKIRDLRLHIVAPEEGLAALGHSAADTRSNPLQALREFGRATAELWYVQHGEALGRHGSFSLSEWLAASERPIKPWMEP
ncbi:patatin-like phospholipase family protein [Dyella subtropica]|uniref:patatin-like phospholipase family protein n=1 Tax=Dyella subtropica TaxID=2992127 RepID=UPI00224ECC78|nr:patatin-like phospholipase family protein [Dyella subtropica]